jgi:threonine synthase
MNAALWRCPCGAALDFFPPRAGASGGGGVWRFSNWLPDLPGRNRISLGEPITPVIDLGECVVKLDFLLPTASFKDRGSAIVASFLSAADVKRAVIDSSGNAAASLAAYLARAGIDLEVFVPAGTSPGKLAQVRAYGARLREIPGGREMAGVSARRAAEDGDVYYASHQWSPFFTAGTRTAAFELAEQVIDGVDAVMTPVGAGTLALGICEGFALLAEAGLVRRRPRVFGVQASAFAPLATAFELGLADLPERPLSVAGETMAEGIRVARPPRAGQILAALRATGGGLLAVPDDEIRAAWKDLGHLGLYVEPTAAVGLAGLRSLRRDGVLGEDERCVVVLTGSGLKSEGIEE